jgi:hypothetical protein
VDFAEIEMAAELDEQGAAAGDGDEEDDFDDFDDFI